MSISTTHCIRSLLLPQLNKGIHNNPKPFRVSYQDFSTNTSDSHSFAISYFINNLGFSPESASKLCSTHNVRFKTSENPNSVLTFFRNQGFSDSQLHSMISKVPGLLSCNPNKKVLPKFQFFLSKGISNSDIVRLVANHPYVLNPSLEKHLIPSYEFLSRFLQSGNEVIAFLIYYPTFRGNSTVSNNIKMLIEIGMKHTCIATMLRCRGSGVFRVQECVMLKAVEELKDLGFHPSKSTFATALLAKAAISKTLWNEKVHTFKKWGWSDEDILKAFRKDPHCMLNSVDKINSVMSFWVNHMGWDALALVNGPLVFACSLETNIIPRATVLQFLLNKGLREKDASLTAPIKIPEKRFIVSYIKRFEEHSSYLLKLYEEKQNAACTTRENNGMS